MSFNNPTSLVIHLSLKILHGICFPIPALGLIYASLHINVILTHSELMLFHSHYQIDCILQIFFAFFNSKILQFYFVFKELAAFSKFLQLSHIGSFLLIKFFEESFHGNMPGINASWPQCGTQIHYGMRKMIRWNGKDSPHAHSVLFQEDYNF